VITKRALSDALVLGPEGYIAISNLHLPHITAVTPSLLNASLNRYCSPFNVKKFPFSSLIFFYCNGFDQCMARQRLRRHGPTRNNRTTGLCNPFPSNTSVNIFPRSCNDVTATIGTSSVKCAFCRQQQARQWTDEIAVT
jgi:hypothetical protein